MTDPHFLQNVIDAAEVGPEDQVIEVGTGTGALTELLAESADRVVTIEIDLQLQEVAQRQLQSHQNITWILGDILKIAQTKLASYLSPSRPLKVVSNPPYSISTPLLEYFLSWNPKPERLVFTFQKEVVDRLRGKPGTKAYGSLSLFAQYFFDIQSYGRVPASAFFPPPEVDSSIVMLRPKLHLSLSPAAQDLFFKIVHTVFQHRRKTLWNTLRAVAPAERHNQMKEILHALKISPSVRGEKLPLWTYLQLARKLSETDR